MFVILLLGLISYKIYPFCFPQHTNHGTKDVHVIKRLWLLGCSIVLNIKDKILFIVLYFVGLYITFASTIL